MTEKTETASNEIARIFYGSSSLLFSGFVFSIFVNILMLTGPLFMLQVYDRVLSSRSEETLLALLALVFCLYLFMWPMDYARTRVFARCGARIQAALDERVFKAQFRNAQGLSGARSASRDLETVQGFFGSPTMPALMDLPFTLFFIGVIFLLHPWLGWFAVGSCLALLVISLANQFLTTRAVNDAQANSEASHLFTERMRAAAEIIRSQGMIDAISQRFLEHRVKALGQTMTANDRTIAFSSFTRTFRMALQSLVLALGAWLVLQTELTAGAMIATSILLSRALAPIEQTIGRWPQIVKFKRAYRSLSGFLADQPKTAPKMPLPRPASKLELAGVTYIAEPGKPALLHGISFAIEPGQALGVIGQCGSGKTSLARCILGTARPNAGEVRLGGALIDHYDPDELGLHIGYLPQHPVLVPGTVAENIARMSATPSSEAVIAAARKANAHDLILKLPNGYETRIEDIASGLSGGQQQRIALARALYGDPALLVLDEPNSALDQEGSEALNAVIRTLRQEGRSVLVLTHRPMAISECDILLVLDAGRVKAFGPREEVMQSMIQNADDVRRLHAKRTVS